LGHRLREHARRSHHQRYGSGGRLDSPAGNCKPNVAVDDETHEGLSSNNVTIRTNNIANGLSIYNVNPNMTMDHLGHDRWEMRDPDLRGRQAKMGRLQAKRIWG
jgi:hypothetical protein